MGPTPIGLEHQSQDGKPALYDSVETIAAHYLGEIHSVQPNGPYFLGGYSFGAMVAFEMAQQLKKAGADVALLALLDPPSVTSSKSSSSVVPSASRLTNSAFFRDEFRRHWRHLARMGTPEKLAYVLIRVKWKVVNQVQRLIRPINKILRKIVWKVYLARRRPLPPSLRSPCVLDIYHRARLKYLPQRYPGRALYIKGEMRPSAHLLAWSRLVAEGLEIQVVPGNHADVIKEPYAHLWAEKLKACLRAAQETDAK